jgi:hypothetical protein
MAKANYFPVTESALDALEHVLSIVTGELETTPDVAKIRRASEFVRWVGALRAEHKAKRRNGGEHVRVA